MLSEAQEFCDSSKVVTEEDLEEMIEEREDEIRTTTMQRMHDEKRKFKEAMKREKRSVESVEE